MTWQKFVTLFCDVCEDDACSTDATRIAEAREIAPDWTYEDGQDICPSCKRRRRQEAEA